MIESKINKVDYNSLASEFVSDKRLSLTIQRNISFVEKYIDVVDDIFKEDVEKQIVYRELGSIVYSGIEAVLKSVLLEINNRCDKKGCSSAKCKYREYDNISKINNGRTIEVLEFLLNTRLFGFVPEQIDEIKRLNDLRNYVHISKGVDGSDKSSSFNKEYVEKMLYYYYEILNQFFLCNFYFKSSNACLKELDENGFEMTKQQILSGNKTFYLLKVFQIVSKLFSKKELSESDKWILKVLSKAKNVDEEALLGCLNREIMYSRRLVKNEEEFNDLKSKVLKSLSLFIKNNSLIKKVEKELGSILFH